MRSAIRSVRTLFFVTLLIISWAAARETFAMPPVHRQVLDNGLVLLHFEDRSLPIVTLHLLVNAGSWRDPQGKEGIANLTSKALLRGTASRSAGSINEELDYMGATLDSECDRDIATFTYRTLKKHLDEGFRLFMEMITEPAFPEEEVAWEARKILGTIQALEDQPSELAEREFYKVLYGSGPYAHPVQGTEQTVTSLDSKTVAAFHGANYIPGNAIMVVGGDITRDEVQTRLIPILSRWKAVPVPETTFRPGFSEPVEIVKIDRPISQANIILGHKGIARDNDDFYALSVMNVILGRGGFSARLFNEIRERRGLAYDVSSFFAAYKHPGPFQVVLQTKNESAREAISLILGEMERIQHEPVSDAELDLAKRYLIHSFPLRFDTQKEMAGFLGLVEYYGLGLDYPKRYPSLIEAVTRQDVQRVARQYLHPRDHFLVIVGDLEAAGME